MFFGSGNLVFPIAIGQAHPGSTFFAAFGILLTGVLVPFLGVYAMSLFHGSTSEFFKSLGKYGPFWFSLFALSLMGPFGVMARCLTVAHGSIELLWPEASLIYTSLALCLIIYFFTRHKSQIVEVLGRFLTPFLLLSILALAYFGLSSSEEISIQNNMPWNAFSDGFLQGYQTMDLLAAFFFSKFIIQHLDSQFPQKENQAHKQKILFQASCIGAGLLAFVYIVMVALGGAYSPLLTQLPAEEMLGKIAMLTLGNYAGPLLCLVVVLACLTTAIVLTSLFARFVDEEICHRKLGNNRSLLLTLAIGFLVSTLNFAGIAKFLGPILAISYPSLIVLTLVNISHKNWHTPMSHWPSTLTLLLRLYFF